MRIAWLKAPNDLLLARADGTLERALRAAGVAVTWLGPFAAAAPAIEALNAGAADLTVGSSTAFVMARAADVRLVMFAYQRLSPAAEAILVRPDSALHTLADLAGHSVAVNRGGTGEYLLVRALRQAGVASDRVRRVYLGPIDAHAAFVAGAVDAWAVWDPFLSLALADDGARILADGGASGSENAVAYFVAAQLWQAQRPVVATIFAVLAAENAWARQHPDAAGAIWARAMGLSPALAHRLGANNTPAIRPVGAAEAAQMQRLADWSVASHIVPARPELTPFLGDLGGRVAAGQATSPAD